MYVEQRRFDQAIQQFRAALALEPRNAQLLVSIGNAQRELEAFLQEKGRSA